MEILLDVLNLFTDILSKDGSTQMSGIVTAFIIFLIGVVVIIGTACVYIVIRFYKHLENTQKILLENAKEQNTLIANSNMVSQSVSTALDRVIKFLDRVETLEFDNIISGVSDVAINQHTITRTLIENSNKDLKHEIQNAKRDLIHQLELLKHK